MWTIKYVISNCTLWLQVSSPGSSNLKYNLTACLRCQMIRDGYNSGFYSLEVNKVTIGLSRKIKQSKSERFDSSDWPCNLKLDANWFFSQCGLEIWQITSKIIENLSHALWNYVYHSIAIHEFKLAFSPRNAAIEAESTTFRPLPPWNLTDDLEHNMATLLCDFKICTSFYSHLLIQNGVIFFWLVWPRNLTD